MGGFSLKRKKKGRKWPLAYKSATHFPSQKGRSNVAGRT